MQTLPNAISFARALAVIPVVVLLGRPEGTWAALTIFCFASLSDALDGPLARRLHAATSFGAFLDPLADKVLINGTLLALMGLGAVEPWVVAVILARAILVTGLRGAAATRGSMIEASWLGKTKTAFQCIAVGTLMLELNVSGAEVALAASFALAVALMLTVASGLHVLIRASRLIFAVAPRERLANAR
jgi:CDP-diacylglycerol--glycerol-3-phosphate 3-phosphatidyltransferase